MFSSGRTGRFPFNTLILVSINFLYYNRLAVAVPATFKNLLTAVVPIAAKQIFDFMIIAYHAIFTTYGTWLPDDPRGSYSKDVYIKQLQPLGTVKYERQNPQPAKKILRDFWAVAKQNTIRPPFFINDRTRPLVA